MSAWAVLKLDTYILSTLVILSRLSNPAQSLQALTVGSVSPCDYETEDIHSLGKEGEISSFSRIGTGIWDTINLDVVEIGGTHAINKEGADFLLTTPPEVCPELIRRSPPGTAFDRDGIGISFSTQKLRTWLLKLKRPCRILPHCYIGLS